jgi:hypothetical protein
MTPAEFVTRLEGVVARGTGRWYAKCPAHDDKSPSLSIATGNDGRLLVKCFAGLHRGRHPAGPWVALG